MSDITVQQPISGELAPGYKLKELINVVLELEDGTWTAYDTKFGNYGEGATQEEAMANMKVKLVAWYEKHSTLKEEDGSPSDLFPTLQKYIEKE